MIPISHSPSACRTALERATTPVIIDLETTGIERTAQIVSAGLLIDDKIFILFVRSQHVSITNIPPGRLRWALWPILDEGIIDKRPGPTVVFHNAPFDLGFLHRAGMKLGGRHRHASIKQALTYPATIRCTLQMLRLLDQDRGGDGAGVKVRRIDRRAPPGANRFTNYKLKDCTPMLTGVGMVDFPGSMAALPYREHTIYLASDLLGTKALYDHLIARLSSSKLPTQ